MYATELKVPNSVAAHALLHTSYATRNFNRLLLIRFTDYVDRRDDVSAANLSHPDALWSTALPFGDIEGAANIAALINTPLYSPGYARHRMESSVDVNSDRC